MPEHDKTFSAEAAREIPRVPPINIGAMPATTHRKAVDTVKKALLDRIEKPGSVSVYSGIVRSKEKSDAHRSQLYDLVYGLFKKDLNTPVSTRIAKDISLDVFGHVPDEGWHIKAPDSTYFNAKTSQLEELINTEHLSESQQRDLALSLALVSTNAAYKASRYGASFSALEDTINLCAEVMGKHPNLKPVILHATNIVRKLIPFGQAAVEIDLESKPNYERARPELVAYKERFEKMGATIDSLLAKL